MKGYIGLGFIVAGIIFGLYVGLYLMLYGGIVQIVTGAVSVPVNAGAVAIGIMRVLFTAASIWISAMILVIPGVAMMQTR